MAQWAQCQAGPPMPVALGPLGSRQPHHRNISFYPGSKALVHPLDRLRTRAEGVGAGQFSMTLLLLLDACERGPERIRWEPQKQNHFSELPNICCPHLQVTVL